MFRVGARYGLNHMAMVAAHEGYLAGAIAGARFVLGEAAKLPRIVKLELRKRRRPRRLAWPPSMYSEAIVAAAHGLGIEVRPYHIDVDAFWAHVRSVGYPANYAAGTMSEGGAREEKLLEYFVTLDLLDLRPSDVLIDVASEWSIFPEVAHRLTGAQAWRQDLIYPPGVHGDRIGGSAARMPVRAGFADKLVLHNAFEHFEGVSDIEFITEAWRVLKPNGVVCIAPLAFSDEYCIITDPLVDRRGITWDAGARVVEVPWWHNRFGRFYDAAALQRRILEPAARLGFTATMYHVENVRAVHPSVYLHFALVLRKPRADS